MVPSERTLSVIIPTYNMGAHLPALNRSMITSGLVDFAREIIWVNDGSTDDTASLLAEFCRQSPSMRVLTQSRNAGRYRARLDGARAARGDAVLFLDSRLTLPDDFVTEMEPGLRHGCAVAVVRIDVSKSVFNLYWERTHALIFRKNRRSEREGFKIDPENFDQFVTGTGGFLTQREYFIAACESFGDSTLRSDDTLLMKRIAHSQSLLVRAEWQVWWEPRQSLPDFLGRLWERGPGFAEYHVFTRRGLYFYVLLAANVYLLAALALTASRKPSGPLLLASIPAFIALSTLAFARGPVEFVRLVWLHVLVCVVAGLSALRGIIVCACDRSPA